MPAKKNIDLDPAGMLADEFDSVAGTAAQANEDRARVLSFYMVTVASLLGAILGVQLAPSSGLFYAFASLFALLSLFGLLTLLQLIRLRQAWFDSALR